MKKLTIYTLFILGFILWVPMILFGILIGLIAGLAQKIDPKMTIGNCWYHALPRWMHKGGYLAIRPADGQRFLKVFIVPHVIWIKSFNTSDIELEQYLPVKRQRGSWFPWYTLFYEGKIKTTETNHPAKDIKE